MYINIFSNYKDILDVGELCSALNIGKNTAYKMLKNGIIKSFIIGGKYKIPKLYLIEFVEKAN